jgi:DNA polymerase
VELVQKMDYEGIIKEFGNPLDVISSTIRPAFKAPEGTKFIVCDLNAIENRGLGYLCRCDPILAVFRENRDPYLDFATKLYGESYEDLEAEYKAGNKTKRTNSKPATLGCGYALGAGEEKTDEDGVKIWTGLMGYSRALGVEISQADAMKAVKVFRDTYKEVTQTWKDLERAALRAIRHPGKRVGVGVPQSDKDRAYYLSKGRNPGLAPVLSFLCHSDKVLEMLLPSGRSLHYIDPRIVETVKVNREGEEYKQVNICYYGKEQNKQTWGQVTTHGGKLLENADQAVSRDVLVNGMKNADAAGFEIVGHTYDEIVSLVRINSHLTVQKMEECMTDPPEWCGSDFPLGAEGYEDSVYRKN